MATANRSEGSGSVFQSPQTVAAIRAAFARTQDLKAQVIEAQRKLALVQSKPVTLELMGKDPAKEFRAATGEVQRLESQLSGVKAELATIFLDERKRFDDARSAAINRLRRASIDPAVARFHAFIEVAEGTIAGIVKELDSMSSSSEAGSLDAAIISWNKLCHELCGPGNALIDPADAVQVSAANILSNACRDFVVRITRSFETLKSSLAAAAATQSKIHKESAAPPLRFIDHERL